jgi:hypothetical protein
VTPLFLLAVQILSSFLVFGLFAAWVVAPRLRTLPLERALPPLLWTHALRYVPLALFAPGQIGPGIAPVVVRTIAWGDFTASAFAMVALAALHVRGRAGLPLVWVFSIASTIDIGIALAVGLGSGVQKHALGPSWYVLTLYVPLVCVTQVMIFERLIRTKEATS